MCGLRGKLYKHNFYTDKTKRWKENWTLTEIHARQQEYVSKLERQKNRQQDKWPGRKENKRKWRENSRIVP